MSLVHEIICESVKTRDMDSLNKALQIVFPDKMKDTELIIHEYDGFVPRLFGDDNHIELMLPEDMDEIVENAVVDAIENGTLFDDADHVKNTATYIAMTKLPLNGMANRGIDEPVGMKHAIGSVVGAMNSDGRFGADEEDIENGKNFAHDIIDHGDEDNAQSLVASYIDAKDHNKLPIEFRRSLKDLGKEIDDVKSVKPEDSISSSDLDDGLDMKKVKEMGSIGDDGVDDVEECGCQCVKEEDGGEMEPGETPTTPTSVETEDANDIDIEESYNFTELDELYQELDDIYASMSSYELNYFLENGEVPDQNKQSKIADTWDRIKQWFKRAFLSIVTKFKKMQAYRKLDKYEKAIRAGKNVYIIEDLPYRVSSDNLISSMNYIFNRLRGHEDRLMDLEKATNGLRDHCEKLKTTIDLQKQVLSSKEQHIIYIRNGESNDHFVKLKYEIHNMDQIFDNGIKAFKIWDKSNRKFNGNEYDAKAWREYMGYFVKYFSLLMSYYNNELDGLWIDKKDTQSREEYDRNTRHNLSRDVFDTKVDLDDDPFVLYGDAADDDELDDYAWAEPVEDDDIAVEEYAIYNEFNININELNELYQELDRIYESMSSTERRYFMETGEVPDQNKQSKIADTWDRIKQWFRRTFLTIATKFKKMQTDHALDKIIKAAQDGKTIGIIKNFPFYIPGKTGADASSLNMALNLIINNLTVSETPVNKGIEILKNECEILNDVINKQKQMLKNSKNLERDYVSGDQVFRALKTSKYSMSINTETMNQGINLFKAWDKSNRKFNGNEYDAKAWREYMGYFVKYYLNIMTYNANLFQSHSIEEPKNENDSNNTETGDVVGESFFRRPKKLKPIPRDVVAYITVEINAIQDANDQAMLSGYTCAKLELVDFYITCLDTNDDRYIVPHTRQYLVQMQNDLNRLLTRILQLRPINKSNRMWKVNVTLPEGR